MGKRGFTLIELLSVIVVLAIIMAIAVPSISAVSKAIKDNMLDKKVTMIEEAAILLAQDVKGSVISSTSTYQSYPCKSMIVSDLVPNYLDKDNDNTCLNASSTETIGCIVDPSDSTNYLDKYEVIVFYKNKRMYAVVDVDNTLQCS